MRPYRYFSDRSNNNPQYDAKLYSSAGHILIALKATEGKAFVDPYYKARRDAARDAGLWVLSYHFCRPDGDAVDMLEEAHNFVSTIEPLDRYDLVCLDFEVWHPDGVHAGNAYVRNFSASITKDIMRMPVLYSYAYFLEAQSSAILTNGQEYWVAAYGSAPPSLIGFRRPWAWQFTDGTMGPEPHAAAGMGPGDQSLLSTSAARRLRSHRPAKRC